MSFFLPATNDSESYFYDTCNNSVESLTYQRSSEHSFQHSLRNYDDCVCQKKLLRSYFKNTSDLSSESRKLLIGHLPLTNKNLVQNKDSCVQDLLPNPTQKRSLSCSNISDHRNSDRNSIVKSEISVSKSMHSMCTDRYVQYTLEPSNPSSM